MAKSGDGWMCVAEPQGGWRIVRKSDPACVLSRVLVVGTGESAQADAARRARLQAAAPEMLQQLKRAAALMASANLRAMIRDINQLVEQIDDPD